MKYGRDLFRLYSNKETCYEYFDKKLGKLKIILTERLDEKGETVSTSCKILRDDYCVPNIVSEVMKHHSSFLNSANEEGKE